MSQWTGVYSDDQRAAIERAALDLAITPRSRICRMAAAGELRPDAGADPLPPFTIPEGSMRSIVAKAERRRNGEELRADLRKLPARDQAESLRVRLVALVDHDLLRMERRARSKPAEPLNAQQAQRIARALRELATVPDPLERRLPRTPGVRDENGAQPDARTRGQLGAQIGRALGKNAAPPPDEEPTLGSSAVDARRIYAPTEQSHAQNDDDAHHHHHDDDAPGSHGRSAAAGLPLGARLVAETADG